MAVGIGNPFAKEAWVGAVQDVEVVENLSDHD